MSYDHKFSGHGDHYMYNRHEDRSYNRARGYGDYNYQRTNGHAQEKSWEQSRSRSRSQTGGNRNFGSNRRLDDVLTEIQQQWDFMAGDNCVPIHIALKLLDPSSLGLANRYDEFNYTHQNLQNALKTIVNEHHQGFNSSIGTFHKIQTSLNSSQHRIHTLKDSLMNAKSNLSMTKPELNNLAATSQSYDEMLQILNSIEHLQLVPEKLEKQISDKKFLSAVDTLQEAVGSLSRSDIKAINALSDLSTYFSNQEHYLVDILVEELHNHLYLKSPYCEDRFKVYTKVWSQSVTTNTSAGSVDHSRRQLFDFIQKLHSSSVIDDTLSNPESDTFAYIQFTIEALHRLGRLDVAVAEVEDRLPMELFKVVEKAINDISPKSETLMQNKSRNTPKQNSDMESLVLSDLLDVLYGRFEAIAEGYRAVHEVIYKLNKTETSNKGKNLLCSFRGLWELYQSEIRSLMHDYLATEGSTAYRTGQVKKHERMIRNHRDKTKRMFALAETSAKAIDINTETENLQSMLKSSVPGLVNGLSQPYEDKGVFNSSVQDGGATGHKLLIEPSIFNMGTLLPPSLEFLNRLKEIVPSNSEIATSTLTSFLDDFLVNVFQPQLEETMSDLCNQVFTEADSFHEDAHWNQHSRKPILKGTRRFFELMLLFCRMLDNLPHDQALSQLLVAQMVGFYEKCLAWHNSIIIRPTAAEANLPRLKAAATAVENEHLKKYVTLLNNDFTNITNETLLKENSILLEMANASIKLPDLIKNRKSISLLCMMHTSLKWLAFRARELRHISNRAMGSVSQEARKPFKRQWSIVTASYNDPGDDTVYLPLNSETATSFDKIISQYVGLANSIGYLLRMEIRCQILYGVRRALSGSYCLDHFIREPDPTTLDLYQDLLTLDDDITQYLLPNQRKFVVLGASEFLDQVIVKYAMQIRSMNVHGCEKVQLNITVLQQSMRNIDPGCSLSRSIRYFEYFNAGSREILRIARESKGEDNSFSYDELKSLLELSYSEALNSGRKEAVAQAQRELDEDNLQLSEYMWNS